MTHNPVAAIKMPTAPRQRAVRAISPTDVEKLRHQAPTAADGLLVSVLAYAGLRPEEALALTWGDVRGHHPDRGQGGDARTGQGHQERQEARWTASGRWRKTCGPHGYPWDAFLWRLSWSFPHPRDGERPWGATTWRNWQRRTFKDAADAAGMSGVTPYTLRHSFVSLAAGRGPQAR
jgi:integrase